MKGLLISTVIVLAVIVVPSLGSVVRADDCSGGHTLAQAPSAEPAKVEGTGEPAPAEKGAGEKETGEAAAPVEEAKPEKKAEAPGTTEAPPAEETVAPPAEVAPVEGEYRWTPAEGYKLDTAYRGRIELVPFGGGILWSDELSLRDPWVVGLRVGYHLDENRIWTLQGSFTYASPRYERPGENQMGNVTLSTLGVVHRIDLGWSLSPFITLGAGLITFTNFKDEGDCYGPLLTWGIGVEYYMDKDFQLKLAIKEHIFFSNFNTSYEGHNAFEFSAGIAWTF
jgi:hypothetical protein